VNYDNSLVVTITVTCDSWAPSSGDHSFTCGAIYRPPHSSYRVTFSTSEVYMRKVRNNLRHEIFKASGE